MERWSESDGWRLTERGVRLCASVSESDEEWSESVSEKDGSVVVVAGEREHDARRLGRLDEEIVGE